jgi:alkylation response protein AidB-like acyl-CoA dehydrogenase
VTLLLKQLWKVLTKEFFKKLGMKAQDTSQLFFDNVKVPKEKVG